MKPPKFTDDEKIEDITKYSGRELDLYKRGWRRTTSDHWTDKRTGRLDVDHTPVGEEVGYINFNVPKDETELIERNKKGAQAVNEINKQRRTMQDSMRDILTFRYDDETIAKIMDITVEDVNNMGLHGATVQEVVNAAMAKTAAMGSAKAAEYVRDTAGDKPVNTQEISVFTDADKELCRKLAERMGINADDPQ